jgi:hypothetical protein
VRKGGGRGVSGRRGALQARFRGVGRYGAVQGTDASERIKAEFRLGGQAVPGRQRRFHGLLKVSNQPPILELQGTSSGGRNMSIETNAPTSGGAETGGQPTEFNGTTTQTAPRTTPSGLRKGNGPAGWAGPPEVEASA